MADGDTKPGKGTDKGGDPTPTPATQKSLDDKLYLIRYRLDDRPHLAIVDQERCREYHEDTERPCAFFCPAHVYEWDESQKKTIVEYERCVECGACRIGCPYGNIDWRYPRGGFGVTWKYG